MEKTSQHRVEGRQANMEETDKSTWRGTEKTTWMGERQANMDGNK
jgi:hypothetical protein